MVPRPTTTEQTAKGTVEVDSAAPPEAGLCC
jgi:hypothetical protein